MASERVPPAQPVAQRRGQRAAAPPLPLPAGAVAAFWATLVLACAGTRIPQASSADVQRASRERPQTTLEELGRGRALYLSRCTACHQPVAPESFSAAEWPAHVAEMRERARLKPEEVDLIQLYLVTLAGPPPSTQGN